MTKEPRLIVRLISLWIIFIASLGLIFWSVQNLAVSLAKTTLGGYEIYYNNFNGGYGNYCLINPMYPQVLSGIPTPTSKEDKAAIDKYNKDLEKYNSDQAALCKAELAKQEKSQENQEKSASVGDISAYSLLSLLSIIVAIVSLKAIKKSETI